MDEQPQSLKRKGTRWKKQAARSALGLLMLLVIPLAGQQSPFPQFPTGNSGKLGKHSSDDPTEFGSESTLDQKRVRQLNAERQKEIVSDTAKLFKLAQELNQEITETGPPSMTDAQLRKVAEIGKLAKSVREKMSFTAGGYGSPHFPQTPSIP